MSSAMMAKQQMVPLPYCYSEVKVLLLVAYIISSLYLVECVHGRHESLTSFRLSCDSHNGVLLQIYSPILPSSKQRVKLL